MATLIDTCVLSELKKPRANQKVIAALAALDPDAAFVSVISIGKITKGARRLPQGKRQAELINWTESLIAQYANRTLLIGLETARTWGEITARAAVAGRVIPAADGLIAATAIQHGLTVMTRNVADFEPTGVRTVNPWEG